MEHLAEVVGAPKEPTTGAQTPKAAHCSSKLRFVPSGHGLFSYYQSRLTPRLLHLSSNTTHVVTLLRLNYKINQQNCSSYLRLVPPGDEQFSYNAGFETYGLPLGKIALQIFVSLLLKGLLVRFAFLKDADSHPLNALSA